MQRNLFCAALAAALLLTGCGNAETPSDASSAAETVPAAAETTETVPETTAAETTEAVPETTAPVTTLTPAETTFSGTTGTTEPALAYEHRIALMNTDFPTRPVPEQYLKAADPEKLPAVVRKAIAENRAILGSFFACRLSRERNCLYVCMSYGSDDSLFRDHGFYLVDLNTGKNTYICDAENHKPLPEPVAGAEDSYGMICLGGKLIIGSYCGFYLIDDARSESVPLDVNWEPLAGSAYINGDHLLMRSVKISEETHEYDIRVSEYDPHTNTVTELDVMPDTFGMTPYADYAVYPWRTSDGRMTVEGESGSEQKLIFEW